MDINRIIMKVNTIMESIIIIHSIIKITINNTVNSINKIKVSMMTFISRKKCLNRSINNIDKSKNNLRVKPNRITNKRVATHRRTMTKVFSKREVIKITNIVRSNLKKIQLNHLNNSKY